MGEKVSLTIGITETTATYNLGSDALLVLDTGNLHGKGMLEGKDGQTIKVDEGAELALTTNGMWGNHYLVSGFDNPDTLGNLTVLNKDGEKVTTQSNDKGLYITVGSTNILDKDARFGLSNNVNAILNGMQDTESDHADVRYLSKAVIAKDGAVHANNLENLTAHSGSLAETARLSQTAHDAVMDQSQFAFARGLWAKALYSKTEADGFDGFRGSSIDYDADSYGFAMGADARFGQGWGFGIAGHYQKSDIDGGATENDMETYGLSLYGVKRFDNGFGIAAGFTYARGSGDVNQKNIEAVTADIDSDAMIFGGKAFFDKKVGHNVAITPYAGIEVVNVGTDAYTAKIGGKDAFDFEDTSETFWRTPVGVRATYLGEAFEGYADVSLVPQFCSTDTQQSVKGVSVGASDTADFAFADDFLGRVKLGGAYSLGRTVFSFDYGASLGTERGLSHHISVKASYVF